MTRRVTPRPRTAARPLLAATLIVRDEAANLPGCLESLRAAVDEIVVYDTGSTDGTPQIAADAGARVLAGYWDHDFARARNAALAMTRAEWILVIDADERLEGDVAGLRAYLRGQAGAGPGTPPAGQVDLILTRVTNLVDGGAADSLLSVRIARRHVVRWDGSVHEQLQVVTPGAARGRRLVLPPQVLRILHHGYTDPQTAQAKSQRNLALARTELDRIVASGSVDRTAAARVLLDLGRSAIGAGQRQQAVDAFETLRDLGAAEQVEPYRSQATGMLAQLLLDEGGFEEVALVLESELRDAGAAAPDYCDWLRAQALARLGDRDGALELLRGVASLVDPIGTELPLGPVLVARTVLATAAGRVPEAAEALLGAVLDHGAGAEHLELLVQLWAGREDELDRRLADRPGRPSATG